MRGKANTTTIIDRGFRGIITHVPKAIAQAMQLNDGDKIEWIFLNGNIIVRKECNNHSGANHFKNQETN